MAILEVVVYGGNFVAHLLPTDPNELWVERMDTIGKDPDSPPRDGHCPSGDPSRRSDGCGEP